MAGRDEGYYGPSEADVGCGGLVVAAFLAVGVVLVAALCLMSLHDGGDAETAADDAPATGLAIDVTDQWAMHGAGLPTKADVLAWHMYGRWGFYKVVDGVQEVHIWEDLPGGALVWDALCGLDPANPAFKFKDDVRGDGDEA
ncbi:MAG: hypothetical protein IJ125_09365 [Atopobiaceae bacterium]|nr:hypothetical protein [Atopobiaceae bacterium]